MQNITCWQRHEPQKWLNTPPLSYPRDPLLCRQRHAFPHSSSTSSSTLPIHATLSNFSPKLPSSTSYPRFTQAHSPPMLSYHYPCTHILLLSPPMLSSSTPHPRCINPLSPMSPSTTPYPCYTYPSQYPLYITAPFTPYTQPLPHVYNSPDCLPLPPSSP